MTPLSKLLKTFARKNSEEVIHADPSDPASLGPAVAVLYAMFCMIDCMLSHAR